MGLAVAMGPSLASGQVPTLPFLPGIDFETPLSHHRLTPSLREISGLAWDRGRLLAHNDEDGYVVELDPSDGEPVKWVYLGPDRVRGDFEGIATSGDGLVYMTTSGGTIVSFREGDDGERVPFEATPTALSEVCEVEGLAATSTGSLVVVCKTNREEAMRNGLQIFAFDPSSAELSPDPIVRLPAPSLSTVGVRRIRPSGIEVLPNGHLLVLDARDGMILELDASSRPVAWVELSGKLHRQPEGIAVTTDGELWIADEGGRGRARLTRYGPPEGP